MINSSANATLLCDTVQPYIKSQANFAIASKVVVIILHIASCLFAVPINLLILIALIHKPHLRTAPNLILTSMAASDLLVGLVIQPTAVIHKVYELLNIDSCFLRAVNALVAILGVGVSFLNVCFFALDRCFATMLPYRYDSERLFNKYLGVIITSWLTLALLVILKETAVIPSSVLQLVMTLLLVVSMILIVISYIIIYRAIRGHRKRAATIAVSIAVKDDGSGTAKLHKFKLETCLKPIRWDTSGPDDIIRISYHNVDESPPEPMQKASNEKSLDNVKATQEQVLKKQQSRSLTVSLLLSVFMACYLPVTILNVVVSRTKVRGNSLAIAYDWTNFLILFNSSLNPIIYCIRVQKIRTEVRALISNIRHLFVSEA
ncbi:beta-1 adrenergic receptor-like [Rhopilema esculentum]|uniref:beta-1 adrenergic receptor-like n=1 Tax=Rhopilema esculentum TaxID=499914 RepID=UPI0031E0F8C2|eukprot:gene8269-14222_t